MTTANLPIGKQSTDRERVHEQAHHFDSSPQQYSAAKLGMWLFLATEILLFGGLFCVYSVLRSNRPELFAWGSQFLDTRLGTANTVVLILSSLTMAMAVTYVQRGQRWPAIVALSTTFLCGVIFMAIKSVEYEHKFHKNLVWGQMFYENPEHAGEAVGTAGAALVAGDKAHGIQLWNATCRSCHGIAGEGVTGQGKDIRSSAFIRERDDAALLAFVKRGRLPSDPLNTTGILMPPKGANPMLRDQDLMDIFAYIRSFITPVEQDDSEGAVDENKATDTPEEIDADNAQPESGSDVGADMVPPEKVATDIEPATKEFWIPKSSVPPASVGPQGLKPEYLLSTTRAEEPWTGQLSKDPGIPYNAHLFFGVYFLLTGLHGLHVLVGMGLIAWLILRTVRGHFGSDYFTPVDMGGLYWHIVDIIWIFLFPLLYLIPA